MALFTKADLIARAERASNEEGMTSLESLKITASASATFDVFLSHSSNESEDILRGVKSYLEDDGLSVYVDKYTDQHLDPEKVTPYTAQIIRKRLRASKALLFVYSNYSIFSRWMPWELGFMDGADCRIGILPVIEKKKDIFKREEFLSLYPYVDHIVNETTGKYTLFINKEQGLFADFSYWVRGEVQFN